MKIKYLVVYQTSFGSMATFVLALNVKECRKICEEIGHIKHTYEIIDFNSVGTIIGHV